jgi:tRNA(His) 5'-end guanylyltransferase
MKAYERIYRRVLPKRSPTIVRVDGKAFHTFTRHFATKPFDKEFIDSMVVAATSVMETMSGCVIAYVESDEASFFLRDYTNLNTEPWFGGCANKIESTSSAVMSVNFLKAFFKSKGLSLDDVITLPTFDARALSLPREEVLNYFLWRSLDWQRNSINMYAGNFFSHKQMYKKSMSLLHEMLHSIGKNWTTDLTTQQRNGTFIIKVGRTFEFCNYILPTYPSMEKYLGDLIEGDQ